MISMRGSAGLRAWLLLVAVASAAISMPASGQATGQPLSHVRRTVEQDPEIRSGVLPNGMRYFLKRAALPEQGLSLRLGFDVGSIEETDEERGFAHLVEHLAFRKTRSAPDGDLDARFAKLGVAFGRDQNAQTSEFATTYRLDFNATDAKGMTEGFRWLRDVADGVVFVDPMIRAEHGVVIAEQTSRSNEQLKVSDEVARFQAPELRSTFRRPNALPRSLAGISAGTIGAFYRRWYRPEHAVLIAVGDLPVDELERQVRTHFENWAGQGPRPARAPMGRVKIERGLDALSIAAPAFPKSTLACRTKSPPEAKGDEFAQLDREIRQSIWQGILNERLKRAVIGGENKLLGAAVFANDTDEVTATCLVAVPAGDDWAKALAAGQQELIRFGRDGPTETELDTQIEDLRAALRGAITTSNSRTAPVIAEKLLDRALDGRVLPSPIEAMHAYDVAVENLDPAAIKASFEADWSGSGPLLTLTLPAKVDAAKLRQVWTKTAQTDALPAYTDAAEVKWPYSDFGKTGVVVSKETVARPGFSRFRFANGLILNFKQLTAEPNAVVVKAQFGTGRHQLADADVTIADFGSKMMIEGGLGRLAAADIDRAFHELNWRFDFAVGPDAFEFSDATITSNVRTALQLFAAYFSDPGFRGDVDARVPGAVDMVFRSLAADPAAAVAEKMSAAIDPGNPDQLPEPAKLAAYRSQDFARVLKSAVTSEAIELSIAGDIDEEKAVDLVSRTLGALPPRGRPAPGSSEARFLRVPEREFPVVRATHKGPSNRAAARLIWPLYVATPERRREEYALQLVASIFNERLRHRVRSELGKIYDPTVTTRMPDHADQGLLIADLDCEPADVEALIAEARGVATSLIAGNITAEEIEAAKQPKLSAYATFEAKNAWWAEAMNGSARDPQKVDELLEYRKLMSSISSEEVRGAAAKWMARVPIMGISLPETADAAPSAKRKGGK